MKIIKSFLYNKILSGSFSEQFSVDRTGMYVIEITASAKSWWQNTVARRSFLFKDSLTVMLDGRTVISPEKKKKILADDLWNGNVLKGHELTVYLFVCLKEESHILSYSIHGKPWMKSATIAILEQQTFSLKQLKPSKRDRIPWMTCVIGEGLSLDSISLIASAGKHSSRDDDDLSLKVDSKTIQNEDIQAHKEWYWCGKVLRGNTKIFTREFKSGIAPTRIDLIVDETPMINELTCIFRESYALLPRRYTSGTQGEDFNAYDEIISDAVLYWNKEFSLKNNPVPIPLDPSLVKAISYIESRLGYGSNSVNYPAYPDIMQVGDERNPAIHALRSEKEFEEYEWNDIRQTPEVMTFDERIEIKEPKDSVYWGVRWLYHKAQYIENDQRKWRSWEKAIEGSHKQGDKIYKNSVLKVYRQGIDRKGVIVWSLFILSFLVFGGWYAIGLAEQSAIAEGSLFYKMRNIAYFIDGETLKLHDGTYYFSSASKNIKTGINPYDAENGPYSVRYERGAVGDINGDGVRDAVAVLSVNYGGTGQYIHLAALLSEKNNTYHHSGSVLYDDRDVIRSLSINRGTIQTESVVHEKNDPLCCPSRYVDREFTLADFTADR